MINTEQLISTLIDDDVNHLIEIISNVTDHTFHISSDKYKYHQFLKKSEGAPILSIAAYFGSEKCYNYLADTESDIPPHRYNVFCFACAGGNMNIIRDVSVRFSEFLDFSIYNDTKITHCPGYQAIVNGHFEVVKYLLLKGYQFDIDEIVESCLGGYEDIANYFIDNTNDEQLYNFMMQYACIGGSDKILQNLLTKYPFKKILKNRYQFLINLANEYGNISCLKCLTKNSEKFFPRSYKTFIQEALVYASKYEYLDIIKYLINNGGSIDDVDTIDSPLKNALTSNSYQTAKYYLAKLPQIPVEKILSYFELIFQTYFSFPIIQLLLEYIHKTLFDMKELFSKYAIKYMTWQFFEELIKNDISLDFLQIELFDQNETKYWLFQKIFMLGAPFKFDVRNKVFLKALQNGKIDFINFALSNGAALTNEIIKASNCLQKNGVFYFSEKLVELLFDYNIDLSCYPDFIDNLMDSSKNKTQTYENLALTALEHGAIVTKTTFMEIINKRWFKLFQKISEKVYYPVESNDIHLNDHSKKNKNNYRKILSIIFHKQPSLINDLIFKIHLLDIKSDIADYILSLNQNENYFYDSIDVVVDDDFENEYSFFDFDQF